MTTVTKQTKILLSAIESCKGKHMNWPNISELDHTYHYIVKKDEYEASNLIIQH